MASVQTTLSRALGCMAKGPQSNPRVVAAALEALMAAYNSFVSAEKAQQLAALQPVQLGLLWAAGWLLPCFTQGSRLPPALQANARSACCSFMSLATRLLTLAPPSDQAGFVALLNQCGRPQVPSVLAWMNQLATWLAPDIGQWTDTGRRLAGHVILLCQALLSVGITIAPTPEYAANLLQPGVLRLLQQLAMRPPSVPPAPAPPPAGAAAAAAADEWALDALGPPALLVMLDFTTGVCAGMQEVHWREQIRELCADTDTPTAAGHISSGGRGSSSRTSSRSSSSRAPNANSGHFDDLSMVIGQEDFWWGGVAVLSNTIRAHQALCGGGGTRTAASTGANATSTSTSTITTTSSSSSSSNKAAELCPSYHTELAWRVAHDEKSEAGSPCSRHGGHCLQHLLLREALGSFSWAMQHLRPFGQTQQAGSSSSSSSSIAPGETEQLLGVQWPLLWGMHSSKAARNSSSTCGCSCRSLTCYVCTPPPRVTLQQLQLVLEVVCLTCTECSQEALRSPLLLALLLQRASPGVRAEFLNSADGTRLLVALQQALHQPAVAPTQQTTWSFCAEAGALSSRLPVTDQSLARQLAPSVIRAIFTLAWCFLDPDPGAGVAAAAAAGGTKDGSRRSATLVTAAAVARGSVLLCEGKSHWEAGIHLLGVPGTSLRLAAGVVPSLALFATLEGLLRRCALENLPVLLTVLLAAVRRLLEPEGSGGCGCSQQQEPHSSVCKAHSEMKTTTAPISCSNSSSSSSNNSSCSNSSSNSSSSSSDNATISSQTSATNGSTSTTPTTSSSSSSSSNPGTAVVVLPGVLEAISSTAVTVGKLLSKESDPRATCTPREVVKLHEAVLLGARLSNAVLQLALQQLQQVQLCHQKQARQQQQQVQAGKQQEPQQQPHPGPRNPHNGISWAVMQLVQGAQYLVRQTGAAASLVCLYQSPQSVTAVLGDPSTPAEVLHFKTIEATRAASITSGTHQHSNSGQLLLTVLVTAKQRLEALQRAAGWTVCAAVGDASAAASAIGAGCPASPGSPAAAPVAGLDAKLSWCPTHSRRPAPSAISDAAGKPLAALIQQMIMMNYVVHTSMGAPLWFSRCNRVECGNLSGPSEAALVTGCRGGVCSRCGVARFCSAACASKAWPAHRKACSRLAAALGCRGASSSSSSRTNCTATSSTSRAAKSGTEAAGGGGSHKAAATGRGTSCSTSSSYSSRDTASARDQGASAPGGRVCAWCGVAALKLLRCGRCKAAWYCSADHQRAAWKAGHKQECGMAAAATVREQQG